MNLKKVTLSTAAIHVVTLDPESDNEYSEKTHEAPIPTFYESFKELWMVVCEVMEVSKKWAQDIKVTGLSLTYTNLGTRTVTVHYRRNCLKGTKWFTMATPAFQMDPPQDDESDQAECSSQARQMLVTAIEEAEGYASGERAQGEINFEEGANAEPDTTPEDTPGQKFMPWELNESIDQVRSKIAVVSILDENGIDSDGLVGLKLADLKQEAKTRVLACG